MKNSLNHTGTRNGVTVPEMAYSTKYWCLECQMCGAKILCAGELFRRHDRNANCSCATRSGNPKLKFVRCRSFISYQDEKN